MESHFTKKKKKTMAIISCKFHNETLFIVDFPVSCAALLLQLEILLHRFHTPEY
jgi:predicted ATPase